MGQGRCPGKRREDFALVGLLCPQTTPFCSCLELLEPGESFPWSPERCFHGRQILHRWESWEKNRSQMGSGWNANIPVTSRIGAFEHLGDDGEENNNPFSGENNLICSEAVSDWSRNWKTQPWKTQFYLQPISAAQLVAIPHFPVQKWCCSPQVPPCGTWSVKLSQFLFIFRLTGHCLPPSP